MDIKLSQTQCRVLVAVSSPKGATVASIKRDCGTTEGRKMISELRRKGFNIVSVWEDGINEFGDATRYKRYKLHDEI